MVYQVKKLSLLIFVFLFFGVFGLAKNTQAATLTATNCSFSEVQAKVTAAVRGDTVLVPAGTCTWSSRLDITKAIKLIGAGRDTGGTKIYFAYGTVGTDDCGDCHINYSGAGGWGSIKFKPTSPKDDENTNFVVTGFDFNQDPSVFKVGGIQIVNCSVDFPLRKIQIYNNNFTWRTDPDGQQTALILNFQGYVFGVVYNNVITARHPYQYFDGNSIDATLTAQGDGCSWYGGKHQWEKRTFEAGGDDQMILEDNIYHYRDMSGIHFGGAGFGGAGFTIRYNTMYFYDDDREYQNGWQIHGAYYYTYGGSGLEVYGNYFSGTSADSSYRQSIMFCRSGRCLGWGNLFAAAGNQQSPFAEIHHECNESQMSIGTSHVCFGGTKYDGAKACAADGQPQHPFGAYFFKNFYGSSGTTLATSYVLSYGDGDPAGTGCKGFDGTLPRRNIDFFGHESQNCNASKCTSGVGCGSSLPPTCTSGTGFWLTAQSCTGLTTTNAGASNGTDHAARKQNGTLYRCVSTNNWSVYYTPLVYPHPLRGGTTNTAPASPTGVTVT